jgi:general secretion pathway protein K
MVILTLVSTLAAGMVWQQSRAVQLESTQRARAQAAWILAGAVDLGRVILRLDARTPGADHLGEPWATPLQEASLSSLLAMDRNNTIDNAPEAYLRGGIRDAQSRYNLRNLVDANHKVVEAELAALRRLCEAASLPQATADAVARGLQAAWRDTSAGTAAGSAADADADTPLTPHRVDQLVWLGVDADSVKRLRPFVELLPEATPLNINTASAEVLAAVVPGLDASSAKRIEANRPFKTLEQARSFFPSAATLDSKRIDVATRFFEISGTLLMDGRAVEEQLLVMRRNREIVPIWRSRQSLPPGAS